MGQDVSYDYIMIGEQKATYRCQIQLPKGFDFNPTTPKDTMHQSHLSPQLIEVLEHLRDHYSGSISNGINQGWIVRFVASENTVTRSSRAHFTHHPKSWKEHIKYLTTYEDARL